jgi:superfamily II DNA helicase RecQ
LSKDQVDNLKKRGVPAAALDSSLTTEESSAVRKQLREGTLKILYVAPER